ncbi:molecular chaperone HtpG, partial [Pseudomonas aeruginosa]
DLPASELLSRGAGHVLRDNDSGFEARRFRARGGPVAHGNRSAVVPFLRRGAQAKGMRVVELGTDHGNRQLLLLDRLQERETGWLA